MTVHPMSLNQMRPMRFGDGGISLNGNAKAPATPQATTPDPSESPTRHIIDSSETHIAFNVMPDRPVREQLRMRQVSRGRDLDRGGVRPDLFIVDAQQSKSLDIRGCPCA